MAERSLIFLAFSLPFLKIFENIKEKKDRASAPNRSIWCDCRVRKKGSFGKGSFQKSPFSKDLENLEILEILENPQTVEIEGESDHFLEIQENLESVEILEIPPVTNHAI